MNNSLASLINSDKKIRMRPDKMLTQLFLSSFSGTVEVSNGGSFKIVIKDKNTYCEKNSETIANNEKAVFSLSSEVDEEIRKNFKPVEILELIYNIILHLDRKKVMSFFEPVILEQFSIRPEAGELKFLKDELEPFRGKPVIEIFSNIRKYYTVIYFLLLTRFAGVVRSDEAVRKKIAEKFERSGLFKEGDIDDPVEIETEEEKLINYLTAHEKFKNVFHLFELEPDFDDEKELHKRYLKIAQRVHPDKIVDINEDIKERANKFFRIVNDNYKILKDPELRKHIAKLMKRYGNIKNFDEYNKIKAYDKAIFKGKTLARIGAHKDAVVVFDEIYKQTKQPDALEFKLLSKWKIAEKMTDKEKMAEYPKLKEEFTYLKQLKDPTLEVLFIIIEMDDFLKNYSDAIKIVNLILKLFPNNYKAKGLKKKIMYYHNLEKKGKFKR